MSAVTFPEADKCPDAPTEELAAKQPRVLCIDDDPNIINSLARNFRSQNIETLAAYHGIQGYWMACTEIPDVIVVDLCMPRGNGEYVIECLQRNVITREIPVVVLSGAQDRRLCRRVRDLGVNAFLVKPASFAQVFEAVNALL